MRTALLVSWGFPPVGGAGVQRSLKLAKYLPSHGWRLVVLAVGDVAFLTEDVTLLDDLPDVTVVRRTPSADLFYLGRKVLDARAALQGGPRGPSAPADPAARGRPDDKGGLAAAYRGLRDFLLIPDDRIGWYPFAVRAGERLAREERAEIVFGSMPSATNPIVARGIAKKTGLPYVVDFRDGWMDDPYHHYPTGMHRRIQEALERRVVGQADGIVCYADALRDPLVARYPRLADRSVSINNGFDPDDIPPPSDATREGVTEIVYMGTLYPHHDGTLQTTIQAVQALDPTVREQVRIRFVGSANNEAAVAVEAAGLSHVIQFDGYKPHAEALQALVDSDAGLLFVRAGDLTSMTGKVFEYIGAEVPIMALAEPEGACADVLRRAGHGDSVVHPNDAESLRALIEATVHGRAPVGTPGHDSAFSRANQAGDFARFLERIVERTIVDRATEC